MSIYIGTSYVETMQVLTSCSEVFLRLFLVLLLRDLSASYTINVCVHK